MRGLEKDNRREKDIWGKEIGSKIKKQSTRGRERERERERETERQRSEEQKRREVPFKAVSISLSKWGPHFYSSRASHPSLPTLTKFQNRNKLKLILKVETRNSHYLKK